MPGIVNRSVQPGKVHIQLLSVLDVTPLVIRGVGQQVSGLLLTYTVLPILS
ncbi:MAG: hypothetical protein LBL96_00505 [Clostridiales bacterium]|nr:hypothetical protein [Clostridiales bacterium]